MLQGRTRYGKSELEAKESWDTCQFASLEANELGEQVTDGPRIYLASG